MTNETREKAEQLARDCSVYFHTRYEEGEAARVMGDAASTLRALLAEIDELKAAQVACVKPHEIERIIWSAMSWSYRHAAQLQAIGDEDIPDYDESGNSNAELAARVAAQRILSALTMRSEAEALERGFWAGRACGGKKAEIDAALEKLKRETGQ